jgi:hypothetical protein
MGSGGSTNTNQTQWQNSITYTEPWRIQEPYLKSAFGRAEEAYQKGMNTGPYTGDYVATGDAQNAGAYNQAYGFGTNADSLGYIKNLLGQSNSWVNQGSDLGTYGAEGLKSLSGDQTDSILANASKYGNNSFISDAVQGAMLDANRNASESAVPNLYRSAARSNALNSDRAALAQGVVERGLAERAAALSAGMRQDAWNTGVGTSANELNNRRSTYGTLAELGTRLAGQGMTGLNEGIQDQGSLNQMSAAGAEGNRMLRQAELDNAMAKYQGNQNFPWSALQNFYQIVGDKSWGGMQASAGAGGSNTTETKQPSVTSQIGGGLGALGGLFSGGSSSAASGLFSFLGGRR